MKAKEIFLKRIEQNIKIAEEKLKTFREAYAYNSSLPEDFFEGLSIPGREKLNGDLKDLEQVDEYGAQINAVRRIIKEAGHTGITRKEIISQFPIKGTTEQIYTMVTNAISSLRKQGEIEKYKPSGMSIKGFYWRIKKK